jgi:hypothetical protein
MQNEFIDKSAKTFDWMKPEEGKKPAGKYKTKASKKRKR